MSKSVSSAKADLEKQLDAAIDAGVINLEEGNKKKARGRPRTKSIDKGVPEMLTAEEKKVQNDKRVNSIIENANKRRLINQIKAFGAYFPHIVKEHANDLVLDELTVEQLQRLYACYEDNVLGYSELSTVPYTLKKLLAKVEDGCVTIGMANSEHPVLGELVKLEGLAEEIKNDPDIDTNVKLVSVKLAGKLPRNPYINIVSGIVRTAWDVYIKNTRREAGFSMEQDPRYSKIFSGEPK